jgi:ABC-type transport system substrate-binding protein
VQKAKALLKDSGYKGEAISITVRQGEDQETEATVLQAQLKEIGMNVKVDLVDFGTYVARPRAGEYAFLFGGTSLDPDPAIAYVEDLVCGNPRKRTVISKATVTRTWTWFLRSGKRTQSYAAASVIPAGLSEGD